MIFSVLLPLFYGLMFWFSFSSYQFFILFVGGLYLGYQFHVFDYLLNPFYTEANHQYESEAVILFKQKKYFAYLKYVIGHRSSATKLMTKSILFIGLSLPLTLFMITSGGSAMGSGLTLGICLANVKFIYLLKKDTESFVNFFGKKHAAVTNQHLANAKLIYLVSFGLLTVIALLQKI